MLSILKVAEILLLLVVLFWFGASTSVHPDVASCLINVLEVAVVSCIVTWSILCGRTWMVTCFLKPRVSCDILSLNQQV